MIRQLPPTAAPIRTNDLIFGLWAGTRGSQPRKRFETVLREYFGSAGCYAVESGRTALRVIMEVLKSDSTLGKRTQVILPAYTCPVILTVIRDAGLTPVLCDITLDTMDFDEVRLMELVNSMTLAVIHVHPFGLPRNIDAISTITNSVGACLIEDACQSMGAVIDNRKVGTRGVFGFASFGPGKPLSLGGGGVILVNDPKWIAPFEMVTDQHDGLFSLNQAGMLESAMTWGRVAVLKLIFSPIGWWLATRLGLQRMGDDPRYQGYKLNWLSSSQSGIGHRALDHLERLNTHRHQAGHRLNVELSNVPGIRLFSMPLSGKPIYLRFPFLVENLERREALFKQLWSAGLGVGKVYQKPLDDIFPDLPRGPYPAAYYIAQHLLTIPTHPYVQDWDIKKMVDVIQQY
ncbi:MAG: hypothetical protein A2Y53_02070 [Chloroflexi bacterium RBG_16_47_49]|nr:MAG: hypothetical protein A2Y53_02070 [Chloroflexi bacterium RBG_16_47_49]